MAKISDTVFIAEGAAILGDVEIGDKTSVWYNAVIRGDVVKVKIGEECNVQDCCVIHGEEPVVLGNRVSLGHGAIVHGAKIGDNVLVGMGSVIMDGAENRRKFSGGGRCSYNKGQEISAEFSDHGKPGGGEAGTEAGRAGICLL